MVFSHGYQLLPSTLHVPLFIAEIEGTATRAPVALAGCPDDRLIGLADLLPTLLPLLGVATPDGLAGAALQAEAPAHPARYVESLAAALQFHDAQQTGVRGEGALLVHGGNAAPIDVGGMPLIATGELDERCLLDRERAEPTQDELADWRAAFDDARSRRLPSANDSATLRALTSIGYLPGSDDRDRHALLPLAENAALRSPLAHRADIDALLAAVARLEAGDALAAAAALGELINRDPALTTARFFRARARLALEEHDAGRRGIAAREAAADLALLLAARPDYPGAALLRVQALGLGGEFEQAFTALSAMAASPSSGSDSEADQEWLTGSLLLEPTRAGRTNGRYDPADGFNHLLRAVELDPDRAERVRSIDQRLNALSRTHDAPAWVAEAVARFRRRRGRRYPGRRAR